MAKLKLIRLAALGALIAWIMGKRKKRAAPEGVWKESFSDQDR